MDAEKDVTIHQLNKRISELEADNAKYKRYRDIAQKYEFRITGVLLLVIGAIVVAVAYPSYSNSNVASLLVMVGISSIFLGTVLIFINTERFIHQKVAEDLNLSSIVVLDNLLRDLRLKNKGVYIPSSKAGGLIKIFIPLKRAYSLPPEDKLKDDRTFLVPLSDPAQEGVLLPPLGYQLFKHTTQELKVSWEDQGGSGTSGGRSAGLRSEKTSFNDKLQAVFVRGLEIADRVDSTERDETLRVRLRDTSYADMCRLLTQEAPQVCEQIGCPLCSLVACIYTEHVDKEVVIDSVEHDRNDITLVCKVHGAVRSPFISQGG